MTPLATWLRLWPRTSGATSLIRKVKPDRLPIMAAAPSVHTPTQKDRFSFPVKYSLRDLNSSEAVILFLQEQST